MSDWNRSALYRHPIGWRTRAKAEAEARKVCGTVWQVAHGRYLTRGQDLLDRDGKVAPLYYGPRGSTYIAARDHIGRACFVPTTPKPGVWSAAVTRLNPACSGADIYVVCQNGNVFLVAASEDGDNPIEISKVSLTDLAGAEYICTTQDPGLGKRDRDAWHSLFRRGAL